MVILQRRLRNPSVSGQHAYPNNLWYAERKLLLLKCSMLIFITESSVYSWSIKINYIVGYSFLSFAGGYFSSRADIYIMYVIWTLQLWMEDLSAFGVIFISRVVFLELIITGVVWRGCSVIFLRISDDES
jgi:hypothetical protein